MQNYFLSNEAFRKDGKRSSRGCAGPWRTIRLACIAACVLGLTGAGMLTGCGSGHGDSGVTVPASVVTISPTAATVAFSGTQTFSATVSNVTDQSITWSVQ